MTPTSLPSMELAPGCPYATLQHASIHFCEDNLCAWVVQPANAYSSLAFSLVGLVLMIQARRSGSQFLKLFGPVGIAVGLTSFAYHASFSFIGQIFDLGSMYCFSALLIVMNARRAELLDEARVVPAFLALVAVPTALVVLFRVVGPALFGSELLAALLLELRARGAGKPDYTGLFTALGLFAISFGIWNLDYHRVWCDPGRHVIQGHAIWHVLNALVFVPLYRFYAQFQPAYSTASAT